MAGEHFPQDPLQGEELLLPGQHAAFECDNRFSGGTDVGDLRSGQLSCQLRNFPADPGHQVLIAHAPSPPDNSELRMMASQPCIMHYEL